MTDQDKGRFLAAMVAMFKTFGKDEDKDITRICFFALEHLSIEDAEKCISIAILNEDKFPTPAALKRCISLIPARKLLRVEHKPSDKADKLAADSMRLIHGHIDGKLDRRQLIEGMEVMHKQYPNIGWGSEASALAAYYSRQERDKEEERARYADA